MGRNWALKSVLPYAVMGVLALPIAAVFYALLVRATEPQSVFAHWAVAFVGSVVAVIMLLVLMVAIMLGIAIVGRTTKGAPARSAYPSYLPTPQNVKDSLRDLSEQHGNAGVVQWFSLCQLLLRNARANSESLERKYADAVQEACSNVGEVVLQLLSEIQWVPELGHTRFEADIQRILLAKVPPDPLRVALAYCVQEVVASEPQYPSLKIICKKTESQVTIEVVPVSPLADVSGDSPVKQHELPDTVRAAIRLTDAQDLIKRWDCTIQSYEQKRTPEASKQVIAPRGWKVTCPSLDPSAN